MWRYFLIAIYLSQSAQAFWIQLRDGSGNLASSVSSYVYYAGGQRQFNGGNSILVYVYGDQNLTGGYVQWWHGGETRVYTFPAGSNFGAYEVIAINVASGSVSYKGGQFFYDGYVYPWVVNVSASFGPEYANEQVELRQLIGTNWSRLGSLYVVPGAGGTFSQSLTVTNTNTSEVGLFVGDVRVDNIPLSTNTTTNSSSYSELGQVSAMLETGSETPMWRLVNESTGAVMFTGTNGQSPAQIIRNLPLQTGQTARLEAFVQPLRYEETDGIMLAVTNGPGYWTNTGLSAGAGGQISGYYSAPGPTFPSPLSTNTSGAFASQYTNVMTNRIVGGTNYASGGTTIVSNTVYTNAEAMVSNGITSGSYIDQNDGETNAVARAEGLVANLKDGVDDMKQGFANIQSAFDAFVGIVPGNVGRSCSFQIGPANIDLSGVAWVREALKYVVFLWGIAAIGAQLGRLVGG